MRHFKTEGIILKRKNIGEADRILTVLTKYSGKIQVKAIGVRRITSRRSSHIEPLNHAFLSLYRGRVLPILTEVQTVNTYQTIKENLKTIGFAYYLCELINEFCPEHQENKGAFLLLRNTLEKLSFENNLFALIEDFEASLLSLLGFYPKFQQVKSINHKAYIEYILEKKLKTRQILPRLI